MGFTQKVINKYAICGLIFNSTKDKLFKKKHRLQHECLGPKKMSLSPGGMSFVQKFVGFFEKRVHKA